jgi:hypothetical protein
VARNSAQVVVCVELLDVQPLVWRRVCVPSLMLLQDLHGVLQIALGWEHRQPYEFRIGETVVGPSAQPQDPMAPVDDASRWTVGRMMRSGQSEFFYLYDPGDHWVHRIRLDLAGRSVLGGIPRCLAGEHACPPEDVGGPAGYHLFLAALADDQHPDHALYADWVGGVWDPKGFDINAVNRSLRARRAATERRVARAF